MRFAIFARDGFKCRYCGAHSDETRLVVDHVHPVALGGTNEDVNLITSCEPCNQGKAAKTIIAHIPPNDTYFKRQQEMREQEAEIELARRGERIRDGIVNLLQAHWQHRVGREVDDRTLAVMVSYARSYGIFLVTDWIDKAMWKFPRGSDYKIGCYVSGIRRRLLAAGELVAF